MQDVQKGICPVFKALSALQRLGGIFDFYKYALVGMALEWIRKDMKEDPVRMTERLNVLLHGELERALRRFRTDRSPADLDD